MMILTIIRYHTPLKKQRMKNKIATFALLCIAFLSLISFSNPIYGQSFPFQEGEHMEIIIHYKWGLNADIAKVNFTFSKVDNPGQEPFYHLYATGKTNGFFDGLFKVRDIYESKFSVKDLRPIYFHRDINEGGYTAKNFYNWSSDGSVLHAKVDKKGKAPIDTVFTEKTQIRDLINLFYVIRAADFTKLEAGHTIYYTVALDRNIIDIGVRMIRKESKKIEDLGTFNTIKLGIKMKQRSRGTATSDDDSRFSITSSLSDEKEKIFIWLSDDQNKLPLYFSSPVKVGSVNGRIISYEGLKYPVTSKK